MKVTCDSTGTSQHPSECTFVLKCLDGTFAAPSYIRNHHGLNYYSG